MFLYVLICSYMFLYVLLRIKTEPTAVIPAQAGIQTSVFQKYLKITVNPNFWIPAYAGMTT